MPNVKRGRRNSEENEWSQWQCKYYHSGSVVQTTYNIVKIARPFANPIPFISRDPLSFCSWQRTPDRQSSSSRPRSGFWVRCIIIILPTGNHHCHLQRVTWNLPQKNLLYSHRSRRRHSLWWWAGGISLADSPLFSLWNYVSKADGTNPCSMNILWVLLLHYGRAVSGIGPLIQN